MSADVMVGRVEEAARATEAALRDGGVVVAGRHGVGRTRFLAEVVDRLRSRGWETVTVSGARELRDVRFGAFAALLPTDDSGEDVDRFTAIAAALRARGERVVLAVDDAHLLDDRSVAVLRHLVDRGGVTVALAVRSDEPAADAIASLWSSGRFERVELHPLAHDDVRRLLHQLADRPFHPSTVRWVWSMSGGNALLARELTVDGLDRGGFVERDGALVRGANAAVAGPRVRALVAADLEGLAEDERQAVELLAVAGVLEQQRLEQLAGLGAVEQLERRGMLRSVQLGRRSVVELSRRLLGEIALDEMGKTAQRRVGGALCDSLAGGPARRGSDRARLAAWRFRMGEPVDPDELIWASTYHVRGDDVPPDLWSEPPGDVGLTLAAHLEPRLAAEMAAAVFEARPSFLTALYLRCVRADLDDVDDPGVDAVVERLSGPSAERTGVLRLDENLTVVGRLDVATATQQLIDIETSTTDPVVAREARAYRAGILVLSTVDLDEGARLSDLVADDVDGPLPLRTSAAITSITALIERGRPEDALTALDDLPTRLGRVDDPVLFGIQALTRVIALGLSGRLAEALALSDAAVDLCLGLGDQRAAGAFLIGRASLRLEAGRLVDARADADAALHQLMTTEQFDMRRLAAALGARACASIGDAPGARSFLDQLDATPALVFMSRADEARGRAWADAAAGRIEAAVAHLESGVQWLDARGQLSRMLLLLHDFVRLGAAGLARDRIEAVAPRVQSAYAGAILDQARGMADNDAELVERAATRFGELGTALWAAEAWAQAARVHHRRRSRARAVRDIERARDAVAACEGAATPALAALDDAGIGLSRREREVGSLAAIGVADKEIAARLGVSVRTVEAHLSSAYAKLGVEGRLGLAEVFGREAPPEP